MSIKNPAWLAGDAVPAYNEARESFNKHLIKTESQGSAGRYFSYAGIFANAVHLAPVAWLHATGMSAAAATAFTGWVGVGALATSIIALPLLASGMVHWGLRRRSVSSGANAAEASLSNSRELYPTAEGRKKDPFSRLVAIKLAEDPELKHLRESILEDALNVAFQERKEDKQAIKAAKKARHAM